MEKETAKVFKKHAPKKKLEVVKKYCATGMKKGTTTCAILVSRMDLRKSLANIMEKGSKKERALVAQALNRPMREDISNESGKYHFY